MDQQPVLTDHQEIEEEHRDRMNAVAEALGQCFPGKGITLFVFDFNDPNTRLNYISNAERRDMVNTLKAFIAAEEGNLHGTPETPQ